MERLNFAPNIGNNQETLDAEKISENTKFGAIFVNPKELYEVFTPTLESQIENPHITISYLPNTSKLFLDQLGSGAKITAVGYGKDDKNEGLLVKVEADAPEIQQALEDRGVTPHITLSIGPNGAAKDTKDLAFTSLEKPFLINGKYGLFMHDSEIAYSEEELEKYNS